MKRLWSPWRMEYILGIKPADCVFCSECHKDEEDDSSLVLLRGKHCAVIMNRYPYNNGHLMVIPQQHVNTPTKLEPEVLSEMMRLVNLCLEVLQQAMRPDGFNVGMNLGASAGAGIKDHIHMHVVPRWTGDTNFMPVMSDTRIICEALEDTYAKLKPLFDALTQDPPAELSN